MESFQLPDGRVINATTGKQLRQSYVEVPTHFEARDQVMRTRKKLHDLPDIPQKMNAISVVVAYTLFGLEDDEISIALGIPIERVAAIKMLDAFQDMMDAVSEGVVQQDVDPVTNIIKQHATKAAANVVNLLDAEDEKVSLAASKDLLDRAGHRPNDVREIRMSMENTMLIEHVTRSEHAELEQLNDVIDVEVLDNGDSS